MVTKKKKRRSSVIVIIVFFLFTFFLRLFHYFDYKTWAGNKKKKARGSFNQIDMGFDSGGGVCCFVAELFSR